MKTKNLICLTALCGSLVLPLTGMAAVALSSMDSDSTTNPREEQLYADATRAINESRWDDAESLLNQVVDQHGRRADGAIYWKAYVENKEGRSSDALKVCGDLRQSYPKSNWLKECSALEIEIRGKSGKPVQPQGESDEDLKLLALNALMQSGDPNALPILQKIIEGNQSEHLKERALFVLAQDQSKAAQDIFGQIIRGEKDPGLQIKAIRLLAVTQGSHAADTLEDVYRKSSNTSVKEAVLQSYMIMGSADHLLQVAQHESDPRLVKKAASLLGPLGATSQLSSLYQSSNSKESKSAILDAFVPAGSKGLGDLSTIASSEHDPDLRRKAIRNMGLVGGTAAAPSLVAIYQKSSDEESKRGVIEALFLSGDAHDLVALGRAEKDPYLKRRIVEQLALMHSKEANDFMMEVLNK
jgi:HEAT repeat protein